MGPYTRVTLKIWMVDPGIVLEKLVVNLGGVKAQFTSARPKATAPANAGRFRRGVQ
jgi:hypothetical protein